jgi:hypothetical protein
MMLTTHAVIGAFLAVSVSFVAPSVAPVAIVAGFIGGAFPDTDILAIHRRTLHFPQHYGYATAVAAVDSVVYAVFRRRVVPVAERVASVSLVEAADEEADKTL